MKNLFFLFVISLWVTFSGYAAIVESHLLTESAAVKEQVVYITKIGKK